jgi:hypothetical protein
MSEMTILLEHLEHRDRLNDLARRYLYVDQLLFEDVFLPSILVLY